MANEFDQIMNPKTIENIIALNNSLQGTGKQMFNVLENAKLLQTKFEEVSNSSLTAAEKQKEYEKILKGTNDNQKTIIATGKELEKQEKQLIETEAKLNTLNSESATIMAKKKKQITEENELTKLNTILNDKNTGSLEKARASNKLLEIEKNKLNLQTKEGLERLKEINVEQNKNNMLISATRNEEQKRIGGIGQYRYQMQQMVQDFKNGEIGAKGLATGTLQVGKAMFIAFVTNPVMLTITAIVGVVMLLVQVFKDFKPVVDKIEQSMAALGAVFQVVKNAFSSFLSGNKSLKESFTGLGDSMKEAATQAAELKKAEQELEDSAAALELQNKQSQTQIQQLLLQSKNRTLSEKERMDLIDKATKLEEEAHNRKKAFNDKEIEQAFQKIIIGKNISIEDQKRLREEGLSYARVLQEKVQISDAEIDNLKNALLKREDIEQESIGIVEKAMNRRDALEDKAEEKRQKAADKKKKDDEDAAEAIRKAAEKEAEIERKKNEQILKDIEDTKAEQKAIDDAAAKYLVDQAQLKYTQEVNIIKATSKTKEEEAERIAKLDEANLRTSIAGLNEQLMYVRDGSAEWYEIKSKLAKAEQDLDNETTDQKIANTEKDLKAAEDAAEKKKKTFQAVQDSIIEIQGALFDFMDAKYQGDLQRLEQKNEAGLLSDKEYAKQKAEIEIKQAKASRLRGIFEATIGIAQAVISALQTKPFFPLGLIMAGTAGIVGGLQIASILSSPLPTMPAFAAGTKNAPAMGLAGEAGTELGVTTTGKPILFDKPTIFAGNEFKGMHIISNPELKAMESRSKHSGYSNENRSDDRVLGMLSMIHKDLQKQKIPIQEKETGTIIGYQESNFRKIHLNRKKY